MAFMCLKLSGCILTFKKYYDPGFDFPVFMFTGNLRKVWYEENSFQCTISNI